MKRRIARLLSSLASPSIHRVGRRRHSRAHRSRVTLLDIPQLEDRILLSVTPLSPELLDGPAAQDRAEFASVHDVVPDSNCAAETFDAPQAADFEVSGFADSTDALAKLTDGHEHRLFDLEGNEYDVLTNLPTLDVDEATTSTGDGAVALGTVPLGETFLLHGNAGASHTIYLDFNGHVTSGTSWNTSFEGGQDIVTPAFDLDGNTASFSDAELQRIQYIWQRVAEDFLPFNVDVTTEDPGVADLIKSGTGDTAWGVRVAIGGSSTDWYGNSAGGVAYSGSFNWSSDTPVFVFTAQLGGGAEKYTAEAISHETGHALGLSHDGRTSPSESYYQGQGSGTTGWAPIMGNSYYQNLTQWSRGEYLYANNTQDDLAVITGNNGFGYRADDFGSTNSQASLLPVVNSSVSVAGIIERTTDVDVFYFNTGGGTVDLQVTPAERGPNLDILASLYDAFGNVVLSSNPIGYLNATINTTLAAGQYYLQISGVGEGSPTSTGYSDYGSLGQYFIRGTVAPSQNDYLSIAATDAQRLEGTGGVTYHTFTVTRSGNTSLATSVGYHVAGSGSNPAGAADFAGGILPAGTLSFAAGETSKMITIQVAGDALTENDESYSVSLSNASGSTQIGTSTATGTILNDDAVVTPGIKVTPISGLTTNERGTTASFGVVLASQPTANVVISLASLDTTEGVANVGSLVFTSANWNQAQSVTVRGVDDTIRDGNIGYTIQLSAAQSSDAAYHGINPDDVQLTNQDNERAAKSTKPPKAPVPNIDDATDALDHASPANAAVDNLLRALASDGPAGRVAGLSWALDMKGLHNSDRTAENHIDWPQPDHRPNDGDSDRLAIALRSTYRHGRQP